VISRALSRCLSWLSSCTSTSCYRALCCSLGRQTPSPGDGAHWEAILRRRLTKCSTLGRRRSWAPRSFGNPVLLTSADFLFGLYFMTGAGLQHGAKGMAFKVTGPAHFVAKNWSPVIIFLLVAPSAEKFGSSLSRAAGSSCSHQQLMIPSLDGGCDRAKGCPSGVRRPSTRL
jgi:hypothetical protein